MTDAWAEHTGIPSRWWCELAFADEYIKRARAAELAGDWLLAEELRDKAVVIYDRIEAAL
jgi:hypothetical protein